MPGSLEKQMPRWRSCHITRATPLRAGIPQAGQQLQVDRRQPRILVGPGRLPEQGDALLPQGGNQFLVELLVGIAPVLQRNSGQPETCRQRVAKTSGTKEPTSIHHPLSLV